MDSGERETGWDGGWKLHQHSLVLGEVLLTLVFVISQVLSKARTGLAAPNATRWNSQLKAVKSFLQLPDDILEELRQIENLRGRCPADGERLVLKEVAEVRR